MPKQYNPKPPERYKIHRPVVEQPKGYRIIPLTKGQVAFVSIRDYKWLSQWYWFADWNKSTNSYYARRNQSMGPKKQVRVFMHREIKKIPYGDKRIVDHREPSRTLDNRRGNLRITDKKGNAHNRRPNRKSASGIKGITWIKACQRWQVKAHLDGKTLPMMYFKKDELNKAVEARRELIAKHHGEFARM